MRAVIDAIAAGVPAALTESRRLNAQAFTGWKPEVISGKRPRAIVGLTEEAGNHA